MSTILLAVLTQCRIPSDGQTNGLTLFDNNGRAMQSIVRKKHRRFPVSWFIPLIYLIINATMDTSSRR